MNIFRNFFVVCHLNTSFVFPQSTVIAYVHEAALDQANQEDIHQIPDGTFQQGKKNMKFENVKTWNLSESASRRTLYNLETVRIYSYFVSPCCFFTLTCVQALHEHPPYQFHNFHPLNQLFHSVMSIATWATKHLSNLILNS